MKEISARRREKVIFSPPPMPRYWRLQVGGRVPTVRQKLRAALREAEIPYNETPDGIVSVQLRNDEIARMTSHLGRWLTSSELEACRARIVEDGAAEDLRSVLDGESLRFVLARRLTSWLSELIDENHLLVHFQPVVPICAPEDALGYEVFVRGISPDQEIIFPERLFDAAREADLLEDLDRSARRKSLRQSVSHGLEGLLFMNCNPASVCSDIFVETLLADVSESGLAPNAVVLEVDCGMLAKDTGAMRRTLDRARTRGFSVALDDLGDATDSHRMIESFGADFVKLDRHLISSIDKDTCRQSLIRELAASARRASAKTIALGVETSQEWAWLASERIDYGQGYLFGHPGREPRVPHCLPKNA